MEIFNRGGRRFDDSAQRSASNECVRLIRKLRLDRHGRRSGTSIGATKRVALPAYGNRNRWTVATTDVRRRLCRWTRTGLRSAAGMEAERPRRVVVGPEGSPSSGP
jgi:hypothetical protein